MRTALQIILGLRFLSVAALALVLSGCGSDPGAAAKAKVAAPAAAGAHSASAAGKLTNHVEQVKSTFNASLDSGRDPFFPHVRVQPKELAAQPLLPLVSYLKLVGIRPGTTRPMALINRTPFGPGEEGDVPIVISNQLSKAEIQKVSVRCLEIRKDSVLISIAGEEGVKELRMAQRNGG